MKKNISLGFTLVELIVVVTILAILGTMTYISLSSNILVARDSVRMTHLQALVAQLEYAAIERGQAPIPDNSVTITASGSLIRYQGYAGESVQRIAEVPKLVRDEKRDSFYTYILDKSKTQYQIIGYFEAPKQFSEALIPTANAVEEGEYIFKTKGKDLGLVIQDTVPVHSLKTPPAQIDIKNTNDTYTIQFNSLDKVTGTGKTLFSNVYNRDNILMLDKTIASYDDTLKGYWDMDTLVSSGSLSYIKDFSQYARHAGCFTPAGQVDCENTLKFKQSNSLNGRSYTFDGSDFVKIAGGIFANSGGTSGMTASFIIQPKVNSWERSNQEYIFSNGTGENGVGSVFLRARNRYGCYYYYLIGTGACVDNVACNSCSNPVYKNDVIFYMKKETVDGVDPLDGKARWIGRGSEWDFNQWNAGEWYMISVVMRADGTYEIYNNNEKVAFADASNYKPGNYKSPGDLYLGNVLNGINEGFRGQIDEVRIYDRPLTQPEIAKFYSTLFE